MSSAFSRVIARLPRGPIARATVRTSAVLGLRLLAQAGTLLIVARLLGPRQFGAFAGIAALAVMLGTLSTFGTHLVLLREVSRAPERRAAVLPFALSTTLLCGLLLLGLYLLVTLALLREAGVAAGVLLAIGSAELLLQPLLNLPAVEHQGHGRIATSQLLLVLPMGLRLAAALAVWWLHPADPLHAYALGYLLASAVALAVAVATLREVWPAPRDWRLPQLADLRDAAGYAVLNLTAAGPAELDKTLALKLLPLAAAGVYAAGARVIGALTLPVIAMMLSAMPRLFREGQADRARSARLLRWVFAAAFGYSLLLAAALWIAAPLFDLLFGPRYRAIGETIRWLTLAVPGMALRIAANNVLMTFGKTWTRIMIDMVSLSTIFVGAVVLVPQIGLMGMAISLILSEWLTAISGMTIIFVFAENRSGI